MTRQTENAASGRVIPWDSSPLRQALRSDEELIVSQYDPGMVHDPIGQDAVRVRKDGSVYHVIGDVWTHGPEWNTSRYLIINCVHHGDVEVLLNGSNEWRDIWAAWGAERVSEPIPFQHIVDREIGNLLNQVYRLDAGGDTQAATDKVFDYIDRLLSSQMFKICDEILKQVKVERLSTSLMRSFLTITFAAKDHLRERTEFYRKVEEQMTRKRGPEVTRRLLSRLA